MSVTPALPTVTLSEPIVRGETTISDIQIRKPKAGEMRGLSIQDLMTARVSAVIDVLPRISMPPITQQEAENLDLSDLAACSGAIIDFFLKAGDRAAIEKVLTA
ncbi:MAG: phage tail assembly protein [Sphingobium sp.]